ncbi:MAG: hypothetical protein IID41_08145 [Planctomycetes bacterium]|nr:hypothetical protein [Planctomycetota bacterium]
MIVDRDGNKLTPTKVAKAAIEHAAYMAVMEPNLEFVIEEHKLSTGDHRRINEAIHKQYDRVRRMMGFAPL